MGDANLSGAELYELKTKAMEFYAQNGVPEKMEDVLNTMFFDQPTDVYGHLVNYFQQFVLLPTVSKMKAQQVWDSKGQPTIQIDVYCTVMNHEKLIASSVASSLNVEPENASVDEKEQEETTRQKGVKRALDYIKGILSDAILGHDPTQQRDTDAKILKVFEVLHEQEAERLSKEQVLNLEIDLPEPSPRVPSIPSAKKGNKSAKGGKGGKGGPSLVIIPDEPREKLLCGCCAISALSRAMCETGSRIMQKPLYSFVASMRNDNQVPDKYVMPLPMITILAGGRAYPGKNNCIKEYMVIPKPGMAFAESISMLTNIYNSAAKLLTGKSGAAGRFVSDTGALCPTIDKPEMGLDFLQEALTAIDLVAGDDVYFALNCGLHESFDMDKGKYEVVTGNLKTADDLVEFWVDIQTRYPAVIALIDPMRKQDKEAWMKLCERVSEQCLIVGDIVYHRPGLLKKEELPENFKTSGVVLTMQQMSTVTDMFETCTKMEEANNAVIIGTSQGESPDSFVADLAVGCGARFVKVGAPCRGERIAKLNRLIQIERELKEAEQLEAQPDFTFPYLSLPPPPVEPEEGEDNHISN